MKLKLLSAKDVLPQIKLTIYRSGRLAFPPTAKNSLKLTTDNAILLLQDVDAKPITLYMVITTKDNPDAYKLSMSGSYLFASTRGLWDQMGIDYSKQSYSFDLTPATIEGQPAYKLVMREDKDAVQDDEEEQA